MVATLHGPDAVALVAEGLAGVCADSHIYDHRAVLVIKAEGSYIIMVVALLVMARRGSKEQVTCLMEMKGCLWIPGVFRSDIFRFIRIEFLIIGQLLEESEHIFRRLV